MPFVKVFERVSTIREKYVHLLQTAVGRGHKEEIHSRVSNFNYFLMSNPSSVV